MKTTAFEDLPFCFSCKFYNSRQVVRRGEVEPTENREFAQLIVRVKISIAGAKDRAYDFASED